MQRQQNREHLSQDQTTRRRGRRSWGELLAGWVLVVCGALAATITLIAYLRSTVSPEALLMMYLPLILLSSLGALGGLFSLLRYRDSTRMLLTAASLFALLIAGELIFILIQDSLTRNLDPESLFFVVAFIVSFASFAAALFFLGRWLSRQEDIED